MSHRLVCFIAAGLALAGGAHAALSASTAPRTPGTVEILVDGTAQARYLHDGRWYVEARKGREYAIRLRNPYDVRVAVALSVDGLNTIDARESTASGAQKWVLGPRETVTIRGWQTSQSDARRFEFTTEAQSYGQALGKTANLGVISAVFFRERAVAQPVITPERSNDLSSRRAPAAPSAAAPPTEQESRLDAAGTGQRAKEEYAATGMGRRTDHAVTRVWLELEDAPAQMVDIRYEFRPTLVRLGILPPAIGADPLERREHARGFEPGFSPDPHRPR